MGLLKKLRSVIDNVLEINTDSSADNTSSTSASTPFGLAPNGDLIYKTSLKYYLEKHPNIAIPAGCRRIPNLTIDEASDRYLFHMKSLTLPEGLEEIGDFAFWGAGISRIVLPKSLKRIGENAFCSCDELQEVVFQEGLIEIGEEAFDKCESLTSVKLPSTLKILGDDAFSETKIQSLVVPDGLQHCGWVAPTMHVNTLDHWLAMDHCFNFEKYKLVVGGETLRDIVLPEGLIEIKDATFQYCLIDSIKFPSSLRRIGQSALDGTRIERLDLPDGFELLYSQFNLKRVEYIRVPNSIQFFSEEISNFGISENAVADNFTGKLSIQRDIGIKFFGNEDNPHVVTADNLPAPIGITQLDVPNCCRIIGDKSLAGNGYERVVIPESVMSIGTLSFAQSEELCDVYIPASVTAIGVLVFAQCPRLHKIRFGGTKAQWNAIENVYAEKDKTWRSMSAIEKIECSDGTIYFD